MASKLSAARLRAIRSRERIMEGVFSLRRLLGPHHARDRRRPPLRIPGLLSERLARYVPHGHRLDPAVCKPALWDPAASQRTLLSTLVAICVAGSAPFRRGVSQRIRLDARTGSGEADTGTSSAACRRWFTAFSRCCSSPRCCKPSSPAFPGSISSAPESSWES